MKDEAGSKLPPHGRAPSLYPSTFLSLIPLFLRDPGRQEKHLPSVIPHAPPQLSSAANDLSWERRSGAGGEKYNPNKGRGAPRRWGGGARMHSPGPFLSSDGHLDTYRDPQRNHFNICARLLRLESRRQTEGAASRSELQRKHRTAPSLGMILFFLSFFFVWYAINDHLITQILPLMIQFPYNFLIGRPRN